MDSKTKVERRRWKTVTCPYCFKRRTVAEEQLCFHNCKENYNRVQK